MDKHLIVVAESVKKVEDGEFASFVCIVAGRKNHAVVHGVRKNFAGQRIALDSSGCGANAIWEAKKVEEAEEVKEKTIGRRAMNVQWRRK
jgi:hypothetical protein